MTYILIVAAAVVWGAIVLKVFNAAKDNSPEVKPTKSRAVAATLTDTLCLDYEDPFVRRRSAPQPQTPRKTLAIIRKEIAPPAKKEVLKIKYIARISSRGKEFSIIDFPKEQAMMACGDTLHGIKLLQIYEDSIIVEKNGFTHTIKLNK